MNPIFTRVVGAIAFLAIAFAFGILYERGNLKEFKGEINGSASLQEQSSKTIDQKNERDSHASQESYIQAINSLDAYYRAHRVVRVQHDGSCFVPQASGNPQGSDAIPAGFYVSPYSPRDTELVAARLYELQQRLVVGGVTIK